MEGGSSTFIFIGQESRVEMTSHPQVLNLTLLIAGAVIIVVVMILGLYLVHRSLRQAAKPVDFKPPRVRAINESAFTLATMQAVIADLKGEQRTAQEKLLAVDRLADENARKLELIAREVDQGLMVFDREGLITLTNAHVSNILAVDTWSRRRYREILESIPKLAEMIAAALKTAVETRKQKVEYQNRDGSTRAIVVSVFPIRDKSGETEAVVCLFQEASS